MPADTESAPAAATDPAGRIEAIDILRGLALFGVLVVNLVGSFRASFLYHFVLGEAERDPVDRFAATAITVLLEGKALTIFAFLFGAGLAMQRERFAARGSPDYWLRRRLLALFAFGLVHLLALWNGDILAEYALLGLVALPLLAADDVKLRRAIVNLLALALVLPILVMPFLLPENDVLRREAAEATRVYAAGSYREIRAYSLAELTRLAPLLASLLPQTLAIVLAGAWAWRSGLLARPEENRARLRRIAWGGLLAGAALTALNQAQPEGLLALPVVVSVVLAPMILAAGYAAGLMLLLQGARARKTLGVFAPVGRMAFTNYILQSVIFGAIFFGYGLGLFGRVDVAPALVLGVAVYAAQAAFSAWWLRRYRFGPLEWLWRSLTYGERQPMARAP